MALQHLVKLEKLKIKAYSNDARRGIPQKTFEVMFNPTSYSFKHESQFSERQALNVQGRRQTFIFNKSKELSMDLIIDGTHVAAQGVLTGGIKGFFALSTKGVRDQVESFLQTCWKVQGNTHQPNKLKIQWGSKEAFKCMLKSAEVNYTLFDKGGNPLRAEIKAAFVDDTSDDERTIRAGLNSPDLTHIRIVKSGDTLPQMALQIYGDARMYIKVAEANKLDDFRNLIPGQEIYFPPIDKSQ